MPNDKKGICPTILCNKGQVRKTPSHYLQSVVKLFCWEITMILIEDYGRSEVSDRASVCNSSKGGSGLVLRSKAMAHFVAGMLVMLSLCTPRILLHWDFRLPNPPRVFTIQDSLKQRAHSSLQFLLCFALKEYSIYLIGRCTR